jgi:hypothetical protein
MQNDFGSNGGINKVECPIFSTGLISS